MRFAAISSGIFSVRKNSVSVPALLFIVRLLQCLFQNLVILHKQFRHSADLVLSQTVSPPVLPSGLTNIIIFPNTVRPPASKQAPFPSRCSFPDPLQESRPFSSLKSHGSPSAAEADTNHRSAFAYRIRIRGWCKHQHPVIAHIVILCPHRVYTTAADDRLVDLIVKFLYFIFHNLPHSIPFGTERSIRQDFEIVNLYSLRDIKPICYNVRIVISMVF